MSPIAPLPNSKRRTGTPGAHALPPGWLPNPSSTERLATEIGMDKDDVIATYLPPFRAHARDRGFMYRNWNIAFSNCVRKDWLGIRKP